MNNKKENCKEEQQWEAHIPPDAELAIELHSALMNPIKSHKIPIPRKGYEK